jgi:hypothetical protein
MLATDAPHTREQSPAALRQSARPLERPTSVASLRTTSPPLVVAAAPALESSPPRELPKESPVSPGPRDASARTSATPRHASTSAPGPLAEAAPLERPDPLAAQQALLDEARRALAHGDAKSALDSLAQHEQTFRSTLFEEERLSLKIKSLAVSGNTSEARALADSFEARFPHSLLLPSVRAATSDTALP